MILLCSLQLKYYTGGEIVATEKVTKRVALLVASVSSFITPFPNP
jgi:hypothetical protein